MDHLRLLWQSQGLARPIIDPDLIDEPMIIDPDQMSGIRFVDFDIIDANTRKEARKLWQARSAEIDALIAAVQAKIQEAVASQPTLLAAYNRVLRTFLGNVNLETALAFRTEETPDPNQEANRPLEAFDVGVLRRLVRLRKLAASGTLTELEWSDVTAILVQFQKQQRYADWQAEEQTRHIFLGPDFFILPDPAAPRLLPAWRVSALIKIEWEDSLRARAQQAQTSIQALQTAIDDTERVALIQLRDALIGALAEHVN